MTFEQRRSADFGRYEQERAEQLAAAQADWQSVCDRLAGNAPVLAALKIHRPVDTGPFTGIACASCREGSAGDPVEWRMCETFTAIKEA